jgi:23S rRNA pseudouridine1911/1915/1917 synthase
MEILFEDQQILAVNKPSGVPSHSLPGNPEASVESILRETDPDRDDATRALRLLHRLDTGTSGVLLFGKGEKIYEQMRAKFAEHSLSKIYWAWTELTEASLPIAQALQFPHLINTPLAHHPKSKKRMIVLPEGVKRDFRGKPLPAHTVLLSFQESEFLGAPTLKFEVQIVTGVMHQIRVHLQSLGFPLLGDPIYKKGEAPIGVRLGLHARTVEFELNGFQYNLTADLKI